MARRRLFYAILVAHIYLCQFDSPLSLSFGALPHVRTAYRLKGRATTL